MDVNEPTVRRKGRLRRTGPTPSQRARSPINAGTSVGEGEVVPTGFGQDVVALIGAAAGNLGVRALRYEMMQLP